MSTQNEPTMTDAVVRVTVTRKLDGAVLATRLWMVRVGDIVVDAGEVVVKVQLT